MKKHPVLIASGASGGHLFPALSVAEELRAQGAGCIFVLGGRKFAELVEERGFAIEMLPASAFNDRGPLRLALAAVKLFMAVMQAMRLIMKNKPAVVFSTGGYASVATMLAAKILRVPTVIHEQNVLPGRANRLLARFVDHVVLTFDASHTFLPAACASKTVVLGTPIRKEILDAAGAGRVKDNVFRLLVMGGSQGSRIWNQTLPEMVAMLPADMRKKLAIVHQALPDDVERVKEAYVKLGLAEVVVQSFFKDIPALYRTVDLMVSRCGVSTMLESAIMGVPAIYVPHQLADGHQKWNAAVAEQAGAAVVVEQPYFTPANLLVHVRALWQDPARREAMSEAARKLARPQAGHDVAKFLIRVMKEKP